MGVWCTEGFLFHVKSYSYTQKQFTLEIGAMKIGMKDARIQLQASPPPSLTNHLHFLPEQRSGEWAHPARSEA